VAPIDVRELVPSNAMEVSAAAPANASSPIDVTSAGTTAEPAHEFPAETTPEVIVNVPLTLQFTVDGAPFACAGVEIEASSSTEISADITGFL